MNEDDLGPLHPLEWRAATGEQRSRSAHSPLMAQRVKAPRTGFASAPISLAVLALVLAFTVGLVGWGAMAVRNVYESGFWERPNTSNAADAHQETADDARDRAANMEARVSSLEGTVDALHAENSALQARVDVLERKVRDMPGGG